jgi:diphthamide synthase subunit DPH2
MEAKLGRPCKYEKRTQVVSLALSPRAYAIISSLKAGQKSEKVSALIEKYLKNGKK